MRARFLVENVTFFAFLQSWQHAINLNLLQDAFKYVMTEQFCAIFFFNFGNIQNNSNVRYIENRLIWTRNSSFLWSKQALERSDRRASNQSSCHKIYMSYVDNDAIRHGDSISWVKNEVWHSNRRASIQLLRFGSYFSSCMSIYR